MTDDAVTRDWIEAQLGIRDQRLDGIDRATEILSETVNRTPTVIQTEIGHVRELMNSADRLVQQQFQDRDQAIRRQDDTNQLALAKAQDLNAKTTGELQRQVDDLKNQMSTLIGTRLGQSEQRTAFFVAIGLAATLVITAIAVIGFIAANSGG